MALAEGVQQLGAVTEAVCVSLTADAKTAVQSNGLFGKTNKFDTAGVVGDN